MLSEVDCKAQKALCEKEGVEGLPTVRVLPPRHMLPCSRKPRILTLRAPREREERA